MVYRLQPSNRGIGDRAVLQLRRGALRGPHPRGRAPAARSSLSTPASGALGRSCRQTDGRYRRAVPARTRVADCSPRAWPSSGAWRPAGPSTAPPKRGILACHPVWPRYGAVHERLFPGRVRSCGRSLTRRSLVRAAARSPDARGRTGTGPWACPG